MKCIPIPECRLVFCITIWFSILFLLDLSLSLKKKNGSSIAISVLVNQSVTTLRFYWLITVIYNSGIFKDTIMQFSVL